MEARLLGKEFWRKAFIRAAHTVIQTALSTLTVVSISDNVNWGTVVSVSLLSGLYSLLKSISIGIPEVPEPQDAQFEEQDY